MYFHFHRTLNSWPWLVMSYVKHLAVSCTEGWHFSAFHSQSAVIAFDRDVCIDDWWRLAMNTVQLLGINLQVHNMSAVFTLNCSCSGCFQWDQRRWQKFIYLSFLSAARKLGATRLPGTINVRHLNHIFSCTYMLHVPDRTARAHAVLSGTCNRFVGCM